MSLEAEIIRPLIKAALRSVEALPIKEQVDVYRGVAAVAQGFDPVLAEQATSLAQAIEDSLGLQLYFRNLFSDR